MGSGSPRSNVKRPAVGSGLVVTPSGQAVVTCELRVNAAARALESALALPMTCGVERLDATVVLTNDGRSVAEVVDGDLVERLIVCMARDNSYTAVLRRHSSGLQAEIWGGDT